MSKPTSNKRRILLYTRSTHDERSNPVNIKEFLAIFQITSCLASGETRDFLGTHVGSIAMDVSHHTYRTMPERA